MPAQVIAFRKVSEPFGWLGNMSPHPIRHAGWLWRTAEALFQALRFEDEVIREAIRAKSSPMAAKFVAKAHKREMLVEPGSEADQRNMSLVLRLKIEQHADLKRELLASGEAQIIEDCGNRRASIWGARRVGADWVGENLLGQLWMRLRQELSQAQAERAREAAAPEPSQAKALSA